MTAYRWDSAAHRYRDAETGRFVSDASIRSAVDVVVDEATQRVVDLTKKLQSGTLTLADWQTSMALELKRAHIVAGVAAHGGWSEMNQSTYGYLGSQIKKQYDYLKNFAAEVQSGKQVLDGRLLVRAELYGQAARGTFESTRRRDMLPRGEDQERRQRHATDSCATCIDQAAMGWQPLGTLNPIGQSECRTRCRCTFAYRQARAEAAA